MPALTRTQQGYRTGASWIETGDQLANETAGKVTGYVFSGATLGESRLLSAAFAVSVAPTAPQLPVSLSLYARAGAVSPLWASGNPPPVLASLSPLAALLVGSAVLSSAGAQTVGLDLDLPALDAARTLGWRPDAPWDGQFALHLHARTANGSDLTVTAGTATLVLTLTTRVFTGIEIGGPLTKLADSRPDLCPICGDESLRETWVWCALHDRLECERCADPDDVPRRLGPSRSYLINDEG